MKKLHVHVKYNSRGEITRVLLSHLPFLLFAKTGQGEVFAKHAFSRKKAAAEIVYF